MNLFANNRKRKILRLLWYLPFLRLTVENLPLTSNLFTRFIVSNILNSVKKFNDSQTTKGLSDKSICYIGLDCQTTI